MSYRKSRPIDFIDEEKIQLFWNLVDVGSPEKCWPWLGQKIKGPNSYGVCHIHKNTGVPRGKLPHRRLAHRVSFFLHHGRDASGLVLHTCDYMPCCNPYHLYEGTHQDNINDMVVRGRLRTNPSGIYAVGSKVGAAKLKEDQVVEIRKRYAFGGILQKELAKEFGVAECTISAIITRRWWAHLS